MKRFAATAAVVVFFLVVVLASLSGTSSAKISPLAAKVSPLSTPFAPFTMDSQTVESEEVITAPGGSLITIQYLSEDIIPTPRPTPGPTPTPGNYKVYLPLIFKPEYVTDKVLVIAYEGITPAYDPLDLTAQLITYTRAGTTWHGYSITNTLPAIAYGLADPGINIVYDYPPTQANGYFNMAAIYQQFNICNRIANGEVDEVWIFADGDHKYSGDEFVATAATWRISGSGGVIAPYCGRQVYTMLFNFKVPAYYAMHSWSHSAEFSWLLYASSGYEACDVLPASNYAAWQGRQSQCTGSHAYSDQYAFSTRPASANNNVANCGENHLPPNVPASTLSYDPSRGPGNEWAYIWNSPATYGNRCNDWQWGTIASTQTISCTLWGCGQEQWHVYYLQNAPGLNNNSHDRTGSVRPNWWLFRMPQ